jgi:hypothetical protein
LKSGNARIVIHVRNFTGRVTIILDSKIIMYLVSKLKYILVHRADKTEIIKIGQANSYSR